MGVKLLFTLLCDDIRIENTGKFVLVGVYNYALTFQPAAPAGQGLTPNRLNMQKLCLFRRWEVDRTDIPIKTDIIDPHGKTIMSLDTKLVKPQDDTFCQEIIQLFGPVFSPGVHKILTKYQDGTTRETEEFFDIRVAPSS